MTLRRGDRRAVQIALMLIASIPVSAWLATTAKADPAVDEYAASHGAAVCRVLTAFPNFDGIMGIADAIHADGFSYYDAGAIEAEAVMAFCPQFKPLLQQFIAANPDPASTAATGGSVGGRYEA